MHRWMHGGAAPATPPEPVPGSPEIRITADEFSFSPERFEVETGKDFTIVLENRGRLPHDLTIPDIGVSIPVLAGSTLRAGIRLPTAGSTEFYCSIPGHREAGMRGVVTAS